MSKKAAVLLSASILAFMCVVYITSQIMLSYVQNRTELKATTYVNASRDTGAGGVLKVILFGYYRTGSTLSSQLFNSNPASFYWFEPLGTVTDSWGWVGGGIPHRNWYQFDNNTDKPLTREIRHTLTDTISNIFNCNLRALNITVLQHPFVTHGNRDNSMKPFRSCLKSTRFTVTRQQLVEKCLPRLDGACRASKIVAIKVIRLHMAIVEELLSKDPSIRIVHLVRDPRGMLASWWKLTAIKNLGNSSSSKKVVLDTRLMCRRIMNDCAIRQRLEVEYPDRFKLIRYEDLVSDPVSVVWDVYERFLRVGVPGQVLKAMKDLVTDSSKLPENGRYGTRRKNSTATASSWKVTMNRGILEMINDECATLLDLLGYDRKM